MKKILYVCIVCLIPTLSFADNNIKIGGDNSFNENQGTITINATNQISNEQVATLEKIEQRIAEIAGEIKQKGVSPEKMKSLNNEIALLNEAKKINGQNMPKENKRNICESKAKGIVNIMGHEVGFLYRICRDLF